MLTTVTVLAALLAPPSTAITYATPIGHQVASAAASVAVCSIRSNAGNCYTAGEFCRNRDLGKTTTDADGDEITRIMESGRPHWHYRSTTESSPTDPSQN